MRILLLNDNPVVRKLVALSAQKTKDDLNVVWSADEIEHDTYDLLIVDDAHYSDEVMATLKEKIIFKKSLLMATRGNAIPAGFDHVINKPFLPTDLVELFSGIENTLSKAVVQEEESVVDTAIDLESMLEGLEDEENFDFEEPNNEIQDTLKTNVLDHEEVQELQNLLDDTDESESEDEFIVEGLEFEDQDVDRIADLADEESEDDFLSGIDNFKIDDDEEIEDDEKIEDDLLSGIDNFKRENDGEIEDDLLSEADNFEIENDEEGFHELDDLMLEEDTLKPQTAVLSDEEFDDLELQIQEAVGELRMEDLEQGLEDAQLEELDIDDLDILDEVDVVSGLDELDSIDEREMKLAVGEAVEPELQVEDAGEESFSMDWRDEAAASIKPLTIAMEEKSPQHEGMEALQALLKALSNDEVVKSLKGLNINININFGNEK